MLPLSAYEIRGNQHMRGTAERPIFLVGPTTYIDLLHNMLKDKRFFNIVESDLGTGISGPGGFPVYPDPTVEYDEIEVAGGER